MAARIHKRHQDDVRAKIQATQLLNYLQKHILENAGAENASTRVRAACALLDKTIPNLTSVAHTGSEGGPLEIIHKIG